MSCAVASREDGGALGGGELAPGAGGEIAEGRLWPTAMKLAS
jgi:hypothetical protein